jgi:hypothetical protein
MFNRLIKSVPFILLLGIGAVSCLAQTESEPAPAKCAHPVSCEFNQGVCGAGMTYAETVRYDDGKGCWRKTAACFPMGTPAECVPDDCYEAVSAGCEP